MVKYKITIIEKKIIEKNKNNFLFNDNSEFNLTTQSQ